VISFNFPWFSPRFGTPKKTKPWDELKKSLLGSRCLPS
jgi:hypothetical protein